MNTNQLPPGWDEDKVRRVLAHYENQTDADATTEDAAAFLENGHTMMEIPVELVPLIRELIVQYQAQLASVTGD